jgi:NAD(P)-dependent dehydrogenase (short-subunit alcohol dehydrogenase family)
MGKLEGKVVLVTGGNSGIGLAFARHALAEGARVVITGRRQAAIDATARELGPRALAVLCDNEERGHVFELGNRVRHVAPSLDAVFINAGIFEVAPVSDMTEEHFDRVMDTNFKGAVFATQQLLPLLRDGGAITFCSSVVTHKPPTGGGGSMYAASKGAPRRCGAVGTVSGQVCLTPLDGAGVPAAAGNILDVVSSFDHAEPSAQLSVTKDAG